MKAILVIDILDGNLWKTANDIYERMKGYKCSLKPMPKKQEHKTGLCSDFILGFEDGWNECLDEIMGETE